jgi:hypothetical protein
MSGNKLNIIEIKSIRNPEKTRNPEKSGKIRKNPEKLPKSGIFPEDLATLESIRFLIIFIAAK